MSFQICADRLQIQETMQISTSDEIEKMLVKFKFTNTDQPLWKVEAACFNYHVCFCFIYFCLFIVHYFEFLFNYDIEICCESC